MLFSGKPAERALSSSPPSYAEEPRLMGMRDHSRRVASYYVGAKRAIDILLAGPLLVLSLPIISMAALLIAVSSRRSPILAQDRVGVGGRTFRMLKLRTMRCADDGRVLFARPDDALVLKDPADERVTSVGRWLRRASIDELPQLINVLGGEMTLVGPRPYLPLEAALYPAAWTRSVDLKPGISGLWQVSGRSKLSPRRRAALDRYYVRHRSLALDAAILLRTIPTVVSGRGAW